MLLGHFFANRYTTSSARLPPDRSLVTRICRSIRSLSSATWEMTPTRRSPWARAARVSMAWFRASRSRVPKPSSTKRVSSFTPPAEARISSASPRARAREAWKDSPPERVRTLRRLPL